MKQVTGIVLFIAILLSACGKDGSRQIVFNAEKLFNQAEREYNKATIKPELVTPERLAPVMDKYRQVLRYCYAEFDSIGYDKYPEDRRNLESIAYVSADKLARLYTGQGKYDSSIAVLQQLLAMTSLTGKSLMNAKADLAGSLQMSGDWMGALGIYRSLIDTFYPPVDNNGDIIYRILNLPIRLIKTSELLNFPEETKKEIGSAERYYIRLINEWPNSELANASRSNLAALYADMERWDDAIETLSSITDSTGAVDLWAAVRMAEVYAQGKMQPRRAAELYTSLISREADSTRQAGLYSRLGKTYYDMGDYKKCRETMTFIKDNFRSYYAQDPSPQKYIAMSFAGDKDWDRAENEYQWLITNFPQTEEAFTAFLDIIDHYDKDKNSRLRDNWLNRADEFYNEMATRHAGSSLEASALSFKAEVAKRRGDWPQAAKLLELLYRKFPGTDSGRMALTKAAAVYREKLDNVAHADSLLNLLRPEI